MAITLDGTNGILSPDFEPSSSTTPTNGLFLPAANALGFATNSTERLRLDASGNLGLGVTPSGWSSGGRIELANDKTITSQGTAILLGANLYYNAGFKYITSNYASYYQQNLGAHAWYTAPSGTAGNAISFTQAMTLDASGNLLVGTTSVTEGGKVSLVGAKSLVAGIPQGQITASDSTALAAGVGGAINFSGVYTSGGSVTSFASVEGYKENATDGNYAGALVFKTRTNGGSQTERARIDSSGNLLVGTTSSAGSYLFQISGNFSGSYGQLVKSSASSGYMISFNTSSGQAGYISSSGTSTSYVASSDQRLKENIVDAPSALGSVNAIKVRSFDWKSDGSHVDYGYIAQELLAVAPEAVSVHEDPEQMMGVDFGKLTPRLVKAIQELSAKVTALEAK